MTIAAGVSLASYACRDEQSRGRRFPEHASPGRPDFQRDRDRVIHSAAFRRLAHKTQVFINGVGRHPRIVNPQHQLQPGSVGQGFHMAFAPYRTRLTHSLEVAQIARSVARQLHLNESLTEAIALAHDLGHTPFGHAGQDALAECMRDEGGFEHNRHSLRIVDCLEQKYAAFDGLNLCFETREGILKHCSLKQARLLGDVAQRFLDRTQPVLEAQIANVADEVAYNNHDLEDALRAGLLNIDEAMELSMFADHFRAVSLAYAHHSPMRCALEAIRRMTNDWINDLLQESRQRLLQTGVVSVEDVRRSPPMVGFSSPMLREHQLLKSFLMQRVYRHPAVQDAMTHAREVIQTLFHHLMSQADDFAGTTDVGCSSGPQAQALSPAQRVTDLLAGLTDGQALEWFELI